MYEQNPWEFNVGSSYWELITGLCYLQWDSAVQRINHYPLQLSARMSHNAPLLHDISKDRCEGD